jgi:hypothetical protein
MAGEKLMKNPHRPLAGRPRKVEPRKSKLMRSTPPKYSARTSLTPGSERLIVIFEGLLAGTAGFETSSERRITVKSVPYFARLGRVLSSKVGRGGDRSDVRRGFTSLLVIAAIFTLITTASLTAANASGVSTMPGTGSHANSAPSDAPDGLSPFTTVTGKVYMSEDGIGTNDPAGGPIFVHKKTSSATVQAAYLLAAGVPGYTLVNGDVTLDGTPLSFSPSDSIVGNFGVNSVWTNVTSIVKPVVNSAPVGNVKFTAAEPNNTGAIDGEILAVIMNDPSLPTNNTVSFLFGALDTTGDTFSIGLASPINLADPNLALTMSIGDSFGYQGPPATGQYSTISVNGTLMTSSAGGNDDSTCKYDHPQDFASCGNGELITVGGIGDSTADPTDPTATDSTCGPPGPPRCDDELYNLLPFVHNGDTSIKVDTANPSNNDNIFFTGFQLNSAAAVVGKGVVLTPVSGTSPVNSPYTFTAKVQNANGNPIVNQAVKFHVLSGPNAGKSGVATTNASGHATFTYTSTQIGTDTVQASFSSPNSPTITSNEATVVWSTGGHTCSPVVNHVNKYGDARNEIVKGDLHGDLGRLHPSFSTAATGRHRRCQGDHARRNEPCQRAR